MRRLLIALVRLYQASLSSIVGGRCRFLPTCSDYACEAIARHGALRGVALTSGRLCRCGPQPLFIRKLLGQGAKPSSGYDPVP